MRSCFFLECDPPQAESHGFYLRQQLERPRACVLHHAKLGKYNLVQILDLQSAQQSRTLRHIRQPMSLPKPQTRTMQPNIPLAQTPATLLPQPNHPWRALCAGAIALCALGLPHTSLAKDANTDKQTQTTARTPQKRITRVTHQRSPSEESKAERDRRLYRECKGMPNAGACLGYTRR